MTVLFFLNGCYKDKFRALHPAIISTSNICDSTQTVSYANHIVPIINNNCINCHNTGGTFPDLSTYSGVQSSTQTNLYSSVIWDGTVSPMPQNSTARLPVCDLNKIRRWIAAGAPNN